MISDRNPNSEKTFEGLSDLEDIIKGFWAFRRSAKVFRVIKELKGLSHKNGYIYDLGKALFPQKNFENHFSLKKIF